MDNVQKTFPQVAFTDRQEARLKNVQRDVYLCVTGGDAGYQVSTKTLHADNLADPELLFSLYYFTDAEAEETKMVLPVHHSTNVCLSMDENKMFQLSSLREQAAPYEVIPLDDPSRLTTADERFFYLKTSGTNVALEAMNGVHGNQFLAITSSNEVTIKEHTEGAYAEDTLFSVDEYNISKV